ncbi:MAG TPA: hypothetical protein VHB50_13640 [Bryobacteraceae bacterium]|nr:hypothetical protein [Bryobacteraceae bacterium]
MLSGESDLESINLLVCERVLTEQDSVVSAIRIVDVFWVGDPPADVPVERTAVIMNMLAMGRFKPGAPGAKHSMQFKLIRPNGEESPLLDAAEIMIEPKVDGAPAAFTHAISVGVIPRVMGVHYAAFVLDGIEVARSSFTLLRKAGNPVE